MRQLLDLCVNTMEHAQNRKMNGTRYNTCYVSCQFIYEFRSFQSCLRHWLIFTIRNWTAGKSKHVWISPLLSYIYTWIEIWKHLWNIAWPQKWLQKPCWYSLWIKDTELFMDGIKLGISSTDKKTFIFISDRTI